MSNSIETDGQAVTQLLHLHAHAGGQDTSSPPLEGTAVAGPSSRTPADEDNDPQLQLALALSLQEGGGLSSTSQPGPSSTAAPTAKQKPAQPFAGSQAVSTKASDPAALSAAIQGALDRATKAQQEGKGGVGDGAPAKRARKQTKAPTKKQKQLSQLSEAEVSALFQALNPNTQGEVTRGSISAAFARFGMDDEADGLDVMMLYAQEAAGASAHGLTFEQFQKLVASLA